MKTTPKFYLGILFICSFFGAGLANAQTTDFSGKWQIDKNKTDFKTIEGQQAPEWIVSRALSVSQTAARLTVDRTNLTNDLQEKHELQQMTFDGKSSQAVTINGNRETDSLSWSPDRSGLAIRSASVTPENTRVVSAVETWTLADGGNTLVIDRQVQQADGLKYEIKGYYDKQ